MRDAGRHGPQRGEIERLPVSASHLIVAARPTVATTTAATTVRTPRSNTLEGVMKYQEAIPDAGTELPLVRRRRRIFSAGPFSPALISHSSLYVVDFDHSH